MGFLNESYKTYTPDELQLPWGYRWNGAVATLYDCARTIIGEVDTEEYAIVIINAVNNFYNSVEAQQRAVQTNSGD
jgi:hypothetical protein